ncbi:PepSY-like domain-containing protein [Moheibacter sediminis]|uniref:Putative beta-lactamase-inhibitor-like, PepSY-like n=1 Tax=Moheibacter sediminis TaxID=1434700 RepID=A0A1W2BT35_9FLAO|nr:PepSY-like domain-containing protein [Moheibacter sediminis]SMC76113.1 Putative beta-lactamase-inhibitor-like, PepSY-like [Moheibacter sediminis]
MKLIFLKTIVVAGILFSFTACNNDDDNNNETNISLAELPEASRNLIESNFTGATANRVVRKNAADNDGTLYEVWLSNNFEIDFDTNGFWTDIDGNMQQVPNALIPEAILSYAQANYSSFFIEGIDKETYGFQVEISNDVDLKFNADGTFIGIEN